MIAKQFFRIGVIILPILMIANLASAAGTKAVQIEEGKAFFTGDKAFANGGAACISCHSIGSIKAIGGSLGPNLTEAYRQLGKGLGVVLKSVPFPTMKPIYSKRPLTDKERSDLIAFLRYSSQAQSDKNEGSEFFIYATVIFAVLAFLMPVIWRNRLFGVRRNLVKNA